MLPICCRYHEQGDHEEDTASDDSGGLRDLHPRALVQVDSKKASLIESYFLGKQNVENIR